MRPRLGLCCALLLAACQPAGGDPTGGGQTDPLPAAGQDTCDAARNSDLLGRTLDQISVQPGPDLRIVEPDSMITMDLRATRLNIETDASGTVVRLACY